MAKKKDKPKKEPLFFRFVRVFVKLFTTKYKFEIREELSEEANIIVSNHAQAGGPLSYYFYYPRKKKIWCIGEVFSKKEFPDYAMKDFWPNKKRSKWFFKMLAHMLSPLSPYIFKNANCIPVYKDQRYLTTVRNTINAIKEGNDIVILPEEHKTFNDIVNEFQQNFVSVAKFCNKKVYFYPSYVCPKLKKVVIGKPIEYNPENDFDHEKNRICEYLKQEITNLAYSLKPHKVVPYENIKKKNYPHT